MLDTLLLIFVFAVPVVLAITVHEAAHGWVASRLGDPTAALLGRVTFNPIKHVDPVGTVAVPLIIFLMSKSMVGVPFLFGWAKPVPIDARRLRNPRRDMAWVAAAGPGVNLLMAVAWGLVIQVVVWIAAGQPELTPTTAAVLRVVAEMAVIGILINLFLMALNLFPLLPLDGGRILNAMLPGPLAYRFSRLEPYGLVILLVLLFLPSGDPPGLLGTVLRPVVNGALLLVPGSALVLERFPI
jgi:Zn-dependent protease